MRGNSPSVIPAKAGTQSALTTPDFSGLGSRFRACRFTRRKESIKRFKDVSSVLMRLKNR
jgi:hypothetical protein